jgi:PAS domain S-box-containing protein
MISNNLAWTSSGGYTIRRLVIIAEIILIIIPSLILLYTIQEGDVVITPSLLTLLCFLFLLIISGIFILRGVINRFITILRAIKTTEAEGVVSIDIKQDVVELKEVRDSLSSIMDKLDHTAAELNRRSFELLALKELIEVARKSIDIRSLQELVLDKIMTITGARIGSFLEYETSARRFRIAAARGLDEKPTFDGHIPLEESLAKYAVMGKKSVLIRDIQADARTCRSNSPKYGSPSFLSIPVVLENDVTAVVNLAGKPVDDFFDEDDERISMLMLEEIDFALRNARLHFRVQELLKETEKSNMKLQEEICKRAETEAELFHYQKNLEHLVEERTKELVDVNVQLKEEISERESAQAALQESEEMLRTIIDSAKDWIFIKDPEGCYAHVNKSMTNDLGLSEPSILGKKSKDVFSSEDVLLIDERDLHVLEGNIVEFEATLTVGDKSRIFYVIKVPVRDNTGSIIALCGIARDITERKRMEERLGRAEKMEALGTLAGGVAHDLNNVLGVLVGYSELLLEKMPVGDNRKRYVDHILQSSVRAAAIIQDLLTLARRGVSISEVVNLNKVVSDYLGTPEFEKLKSYNKNVKIWAELDQGLLSIKGSPIHLGKTIMNLVSNATEAISGQGEVMIRTENRYLDQPIQGYDEMKEGDYVLLTVSDTGSGISSKDLEKIFEPFYTKKNMGRSGTGLGLAVVWGTVKDHRGYIDVQSEEGKGSTFTLYLPVTREEPAKIEKAASPSSYMGKSESILIVDDVQAQRDVAMSMLGRLGYNVEAVANGEAAIEFLKNKKADMIVLDMIMDPGMDGMDTYRKILEINPKQKAVLVSGFSETDRVAKAQEMGAGAFIRKPYILEKIGLAIRKELDRK